MTTLADVEATLAAVAQLFARASDGTLYLRGRFVDYPLDLGFALQKGSLSHPYAEQLSISLQNIVWDLWNIGTLFDRLDRTDGLATTGALGEDPWRLYCGLDIEHFFIELRSILDYAARCIAAVADRPGTVPGESMNELRNWLDRNPGNASRLGIDLVPIVHSHPRFPDIKDVRDEIVHRGGLTMLYGSPGEGLLFQVHQSWRPIVTAPEEAMTPEGLIDFRRYGSLLFAELLVFLERLGTGLAQRLPVKHIGLGDAQIKGPGWDVFLSWLASWRAPH